MNIGDRVEFVNDGGYWWGAARIVIDRLPIKLNFQDVYGICVDPKGPFNEKDGFALFTKDSNVQITLNSGRNEVWPFSINSFYKPYTKEHIVKRYVEKKEETTSKIGKICGFVITGDIKGYLVYVGKEGSLNAVLVEECDTAPNTPCGSHLNNSFSSVEDFVKNANKHFEKNNVLVHVKDFYFFETLKEMYRWLSE